MSNLPWKPWHEAVKLRDDLKTGELTLAMFAADLYEVIMGEAKPIYGDAAEFFALTYPTVNIQTLAKEVLQRLAGKSDKATRLLELTYGGGKTHTLITLLHLVRDPANLPDLPAVDTFRQAAGMNPPQARIAVLPFDKLDPEKGMEIIGPRGGKRWLKYPWSILAWQIDEADGLRLLHAEDKAEERETAPAENLLKTLLAAPGKHGLSTLILIDEVLMYARAKVGIDPAWRGRLQDFFQFLTQAAAKVDRCAVVASLIATDPRKSDELGREIQNDLAQIFRRGEEEGIQPVLEGDVAEVLRRRFFTPESIKDRSAFQPHVVAALKGVEELDEQTKKSAQTEQARFEKSYPFHPDLTKVLYEKWTNIPLFQKTRGVLRTFALALREAEKWDNAPLIGTNVFLGAPGTEDISEALRELASIAGLDAFEGPAQNWTAILQGELAKARTIQKEQPTLRVREIEQAVVGVFLHSQPIGQNHKAQTRDLMLLLGPGRPDRITLEKALIRWAEISWFLDEATLVEKDGKKELPKSWRLGSRPNLRQMHYAASAERVSAEAIESRLGSDIEKLKSLTSGASAAGARVHTLPVKPSEIEDDGEFHYAVLGPKAASMSGTPSVEAKRFIEETTGPDRPRVFRNAVVLAVPSRDGLDAARKAIRDYMGWEEVRLILKGQELDPLRAERLATETDRALKNIAHVIQQAYCLVVTVSDKNDIQGFKLTVGGSDVLFNLIKNDERSRIRDTAVTADALLPGGPYNLWHGGETSRRVKDLVGAFAQVPKLPKMLRRKEILATLLDGARQGFFVLRVTRPDKTVRTMWRQEVEASDQQEPSLEVVLPEAAELTDIAPSLLTPGTLPGLWPAVDGTITVGELLQYFGGETVVQMRRETANGQTYDDPAAIPKASRGTMETAVSEAVAAGRLWLRAGVASICGEAIPTGVLSDSAMLAAPPPAIDIYDLLPAGLPAAWKEGETTGLGLSTSLSHKTGSSLPWSTVREAIDGALRARVMELPPDSGVWPSPLSGAAAVKLRLPIGNASQPQPDPKPTVIPTPPGIRTAESDLQSSEIQDLADAMGELLGTTVGIDLKFHLRIELGPGVPVPEGKLAAINAILKKVSSSLELH